METYNSEKKFENWIQPSTTLTSPVAIATWFRDLENSWKWSSNSSWDRKSTFVYWTGSIAIKILLLYCTVTVLTVNSPECYAWRNFILLRIQSSGFHNQIWTVCTFLVRGIQKLHPLIGIFVARNYPYKISTLLYDRSIVPQHY